MSECRLLAENDRKHFMDAAIRSNGIGAKAFHAIALRDRSHGLQSSGHVQLRASPRSGSALGTSPSELQQLFLRACFNIMGRNQDDHTKNIAFLMDKSGRWSLAPAFDVTYSYNPQGLWTNQHQMSLGGKRDHFSARALLRCCKTLSTGQSRQSRQLAGADRCCPATLARVRRSSEVSPAWTQQIAQHHRRLATLG